MNTGIPFGKRVLKRSLDLLVAIPASVVSLPLVALLVVAASIDTRAPGLFVQRRIGRHGRPFPLFKVRTMRADTDLTSTVTAAGDRRITTLGGWLRRLKLDELPQFWNVVLGHMSLVGPRPDVAGFADVLTGGDRILLTIRPGITGPATLAFRDEERILAAQLDPEDYNRRVLWPAKVRINLRYISDYRLIDDVRYLWITFSGRRLGAGSELTDG